MPSALTFLRANPVFSVTLGVFVGCTIIFSVLIALMTRSGVSPRPIIFFAGYLGIIVAPMLLFHGAQAFGLIPRRDLTWTSDGSSGSASTAPLRVRGELLTAQNGQFTQPSLVFGNGYHKDLISDLRERLPDVFRNAIAANMAIMSDGSSVVVATFANAVEAETATEQYLQRMIGEVPTVGADGTRTVNRATDVVKVLVRDATMIAWSGANAERVEAAFVAAPLLERTSVNERTADEGRDFWLYRPYVLASLLILLLIIAAMWFFRMSTWASESAAVANTTPVSLNELRNRLLSVNSLDVPFTVEPVPGSDSRLQVTWRYADAKWLDLARARGMRRTHRILLDFDTSNHMVRPLEQQAQIDWSAGVGGADLQWKMELGVVFFQRERSTVYGLQLDPSGRLTRNLSYTYTFDLQEMKQPLIQAVTHAGWSWRPTLLRGPSWLRWLTGA